MSDIMYQVSEGLLQLILLNGKSNMLESIQTI